MLLLNHIARHYSHPVIFQVFFPFLPVPLTSSSLPYFVLHNVMSSCHFHSIFSSLIVLVAPFFTLDTLSYSTLFPITHSFTSVVMLNSNEIFQIVSELLHWTGSPLPALNLARFQITVLFNWVPLVITFWLNSLAM